MNSRLRYGLLALVILIIEFIIGIWIHDSIVRPFIGDVLIVVFIYSCLRIFVKPYGWLPYAVLALAIITEIGQKLKVLSLIGLDHIYILRVIFGATFDWLDLVSYVIGFIFILLIASFEKNRLQVNSNTTI